MSLDIIGKIDKAILKRKSKKHEKEARKIELEMNTIRDENLCLTFLNLIKAEFLKYMLLDYVDYEIFGDVKNKSLDETLNNGIEESNSFVFDYSFVEFGKTYKELRSYMIGIENRIGNINDNKYVDSLTNRVKKVASNKFNDISKNNSQITFTSSERDERFYTNVGIYLECLDDLLKNKLNFRKEDIRYIKTFMTKVKKLFLKIDEHMMFCDEKQIYTNSISKCLELTQQIYPEQYKEDGLSYKKYLKSISEDYRLKEIKWLKELYKERIEA